MKTRLSIAVLALLVVGATVVSAQQHQHSIPSGMVSGDRIPDSVAYRAYMTHLSQLPAGLQAQQVALVKLSKADSAVLTKSLGGFREKYLALVETYNAEATAAEANGKAVNALAHHAAVVKLVDETVRELFSNLSTDGVGKFVSRVKAEKQSMWSTEREAIR